MSSDITLITRVIGSIEMAKSSLTVLPEGVTSLQGMSGVKFRCFLNNLMHGLSYLELGAWKGSTFISAVYKNMITSGYALAIDNFSEFNKDNDIKLALTQNCKKFLVNDERYEIIDASTDDFDIKSCDKRFDVFFYDADHHTAPTRDGITKFSELMHDTFVLIVDDYSWENVKNGTEQAIKAISSKFEMVFKMSIGTEVNNDNMGWWNGVGVFIFKRKTP